MTRPRVMMLLASAIDYDTRVKKEAVSLAQAGFDVTVVSRSASGDQSFTNLHGATIVRQPVPYVLSQVAQRRAISDAGVRSWNEKHGGGPIAAFRSREERRWREGLDRRDALMYANAMTAIYRVELNALRGLESRTGLTTDLRRRKNLPDAGSIGNRLRLFFLRAALKLKWPPSIVAGTWPRIRSVRRMEQLWSDRLDHLQAEMDSPPTPVPGDRPWNEVLPYLLDTEIAFAQLVERFQPHAIHAHDFFALPMAVRAKQALLAKGWVARIVYDSHEFVTGLGAHYSEELFKAYVEIEEGHIDKADAVVTVTDEISDRLKEIYSLSRSPVVVHNAPPAGSTSGSNIATIRAVVGLDPSVPLGVYVGSVNPNRGLDVLIAALPMVPGFHVAVAATRLDPGLQEELEELAVEAGVTDRLHYVDPVDPYEVVRYISDADVGLIVSRNSVLNHQVSLPNKLFEYLHAGLPIITSNCSALVRFIAESGVGEVFTSEDAQDLATAIERLIKDHETYRARIDRELITRYSWETAQGRLIALYNDLLGTRFDLNPPHPLTLDETMATL